MISTITKPTTDNNQTDEKEIMIILLQKTQMKILLYLQQHGVASMIYISFAEENGDFLGKKKQYLQMLEPKQVFDFFSERSPQ